MNNGIDGEMAVQRRPTPPRGQAATNWQHKRSRAVLSPVQTCFLLCLSATSPAVASPEAFPSLAQEQFIFLCQMFSPCLTEFEREKEAA